MVAFCGLAQLPPAERRCVTRLKIVAYHSRQLAVRLAEKQVEESEGTRLTLIYLESTEMFLSPSSSVRGANRITTSITLAEVCTTTTPKELYVGGKQTSENFKEMAHILSAVIVPRVGGIKENGALRTG